MDGTPFDREELANQLIAMAQGFGIAVAPESAQAMVRHLELVIERNKVLNLTRIVDPHQGVVLHLLDSLLLAPSIVSALGDASDLRFIDIGTGAGFPGIPLSLQLNMRGTLIDSVGKKVRAVEEFVEELGLRPRLDCQAVRAEDLARAKSRSYDVVTARAVARLATLVEYASPLLRRGGVLVVSKGNIEQQELDEGTSAARICGMELVSRETLELPEEAGHREILAYRKVRKPSVKLPRATSMAKNHPLA